MNKLWKIFFQGLVALLPIALTLYLLYWLATSAEAIFGGFLVKYLSESFYFPGLGILVGLLCVFIVGLFINAYVGQKLLQVSEALFDHIPFVKTLYGSLRDLMGLFSTTQQKEGLDHVVSVTFPNNMTLIGFVTAHTVSHILPGDNERVAVYFPLSYQIGGYTVLLPKDQLTSLDINVADAMKLILTAGVSNDSK